MLEWNDGMHAFTVIQFNIHTLNLLGSGQPRAPLFRCPQKVNFPPRGCAGKVRAHAVADRSHCKNGFTKCRRLRRRHVNIIKTTYYNQAYVYILSLFLVTCTQCYDLSLLSDEAETEITAKAVKVAQEYIKYICNRCGRVGKNVVEPEQNSFRRLPH